MLDSARLIFDLQKVNRIIQQISGCLDPTLIASDITKALIDAFDCALSRIWLTEMDGQALRLVASAGLYTRTDGSFARVPMGAYKVGKIAKNCIPFLSNHLAEETWVKDRDWAIANKIHGFAGYPLMGNGRVIGVLAVFSQEPFLPEFLEVLQVLCMAAAIALDAAQQTAQSTETDLTQTQSLGDHFYLSDYLSRILTATKLILIGTEKKLPPAIGYLLLRTTEILNQLRCSYCRLNYEDQVVILEGIVAMSRSDELHRGGRSPFLEIKFLAHHLGGEFITQSSSNQSVLQISLQLPYSNAHQILLETQILSQREQEVITLLTQGLRDRDIAEKLHISESTVKFHLNSTLSKLKAKNRYQAIYQATKQGFI